MGKRLVLALGGNALGSTPQKQLELVRQTAEMIVDLIEEGHEIIIGHGNGPQVGMVNLAFDTAEKTGLTPEMPFPECVAMTQSYIGYHLQQALQNALKERNIHKDVVTVVTQIEVAEDDPAFQVPTKPIGSFYNKEDAEKIMAATGYTFKEDARRGYRRVVASPLPIAIVELDVIRKLIAQDTIVITIGGGGIPVVCKDGRYEGIAAVIDKDRASARLALDTGADMLVILTAVEKVSLNYATPEQIDLDVLTVEEAKRYMNEGHFASGSMLPKVEACLDFVEQTSGEALITSLAKAKEALAGKTGTLIRKS